MDSSQKTVAMSCAHLYTPHMQLLITICARGGSKGIPGKNIKPVGGKPLIAYSIAHAQEFAAKHSADIALSTDSEEIRSIAAGFGLTTKYLRPDELAGDDVGKIPVLADLLKYSEENASKKYDMVLDLDVASPMRTQEDLEKGYAQIQHDEHALNLFSVSPSARSPYYTMVEEGGQGYFNLVKPPDSPIFARQNAPLTYDMNGSFYFYRDTFFQEQCQSALTPRSLVYVIPHICFDFDEAVDFDFFEYMLNNDALGFSV